MSNSTYPTVISLAMPLGNPKDISFRAVEALTDADFIYCEDKRKLKFLCSALAIQLKSDVKLRVVPGSREWDENWSRLGQEAAGKNVLMLSDAGTPIINDPGAAIVQYAREQGWPLVSLPGPSAPILAVQKTGGYGLPLLFFGFAPKASHADKKNFQDFLSAIHSAGTFVFFDTKYQIGKTLEALAQAGEAERPLVVLKDMTKQFEGEFVGSVGEVSVQIAQHLEKEDGIGELTVVLKGGQEQSTDQAQEQSTQAAEWIAFRNAAPRKAAKILAQKFGLKSQESYKLISGKES